jgi:hypothetical protein
MDMHAPAPEASFDVVLARLSPTNRARLEDLAGPAADGARAAAAHWDFSLPAAAVDRVIGEVTDDFRRALIAFWVRDVETRAGALDMPPEVMELYPYWLDQMAAFLTEAEDPYDPDHWAKDVRFALALSVPGARSQVIDLSSPLGPGETVRHALSGRGIAPLFRYVAARAWRPWLEVHTEARHLADFNEEGWNRAWATAAAICKRRPELAGMIGSSWFYDPPLTEISPRLAHLRLNPLNGGAWMVHQGPGEIHTERAATASPTRKAMIDSGEYVARAWMMVWPRKALIRWADGRDQAQRD